MVTRMIETAFGMRTLWPTRKWWAATVTAVGGFVATLASTGWHFTPQLNGALITIATQRVVAYIVANEDTPGGLPMGRPPGAPVEPSP
jgi:hypothetical protein